MIRINWCKDSNFKRTTFESLPIKRLAKQSTVTDAAGTRTFAYNADFDLTSETINGIYSKVLNGHIQATIKIKTRVECHEQQCGTASLHLVAGGVGYANIGLRCQR